MQHNSICEEDTTFAFRVFIEYREYREGEAALNCVFVDLNKEYDRGTRGTVALYKEVRSGRKVSDSGEGHV